MSLEVSQSNVEPTGKLHRNHLASAGSSPQPSSALSPPPPDGSQLPSHLTCFVCHGSLKEPRILACLHFMCTSCLASAGGGSAAAAAGAPHNSRGAVKADDDDDIAPSSETFSAFKPPMLICPMCAYPTTTTSVDRLPLNYAAIEELRRLEGFGSCCNCNEEEASRFCPECASCMCSGCSDRIHAHRIFQSHRPIVFREPCAQSSGATGAMHSHRKEFSLDVKEPAAVHAAVAHDQSFIPVPCYRHVHESLVSFCRSCCHSVCPRCIEEEHSGHPIGTLKAVTDSSMAAELPEFVETLSGITSRCDAATLAVDLAIEELGAQKAECLDRLQKNMQLLRGLIARRAAELEGVVKAEHQRKLLLLHQQRKTLATRKDAATTALWVVSTLEPASSSVDEAGGLNADAAAASTAAPPPQFKQLMIPPCNHTPSVLADTTVTLEKVTTYAASQRIDVTPIVETKLRLSFNGQVEPVERLLQSFGTFFSKKSRERKFAVPVVEVDTTATTAAQQARPSSSLGGRLTPAGLGDSQHNRPSTTPRGAASAAPPAPFFSPLELTESDTTGILYFFGCDSGVKSYQNPLIREAIEVRASSVGYGKLEHVVHYAASQRKKKPSPSSGQTTSRTSTTTSPLRGGSSHASSGGSGGAKEFCTNNTPYSWVMIKLPAAVELHGYSLYHDAFDASSHFLRNWEVRGLVSCSAVAAADGVGGGGGPIFSEDIFRERYSYSGPLYVEVADGKWSRASDPESVRHLEHLTRVHNEATVGIDPPLPKWWIVLDSRRNCDALRVGCASACFSTNCGFYLSRSQASGHAEGDVTPAAHFAETPRSGMSAQPTSIATTPPCTQFMVIQTNVNSSSNHHLMVSCIELFGALQAS